MKTSQKGFITPLLLVLIAILLVGGGTYAYVTHQSATQTLNSQTAGWKIYTNAQYGFVFSYPTGWAIKEETISSQNNIVGSYVLVEKDGYVLRFRVDSQGGSFKAAVNAKDYKSIIFENGLQTWRTKNPELSEEGAIPFFQLGILTPDNRISNYDSNFSSPIVRNKNLSFSVDYKFPNGVSAKNYDTNMIGIMDKIASTFKLTQPPTSQISDNTTNWKTYSDRQGQFSIKYPLDGITVKSGGDLHGSFFSLPSEYWKGTNLSDDSFISVELSSGACSKNSFIGSSGKNDSVTTATVNGTNYTVVTHPGEAMGNSYKEIVYFTPQNSVHNPCSGIRLFLHSNPLSLVQENDKSIKAYDENKILDFFQKVISTITFTVSD